jgi:hypothetical protein
MKFILPLAALLCASSAYGQTITDSFSTWEANTSGVSETSNFGVSDFTTISGFNLVGGGSVSLGASAEVVSIGDGWATWSGGYTGQVFSPSNSASTFSFGSGVSSLGFYIEPDEETTEAIMVTLANGETLTDDINGAGGASFFGYYGGPVTSLTIDDLAGDTFAMGEFYSGSSSAPVPEPASVGFLAIGMLSLAGVYTRSRRNAV